MVAMAQSSPGLAGSLVRRRFPFPAMFLLLAVMRVFLAGEIPCAADSSPKSIHLNLKVKAIHHHRVNWQVRERRRLWLENFDQLVGPPESTALPSGYVDAGSVDFPLSSTPLESAAGSGGFAGGGGEGGGEGGGTAPPSSSHDDVSMSFPLSSSPDLMAGPSGFAAGGGGGEGGGGRRFVGDLILRRFLKSGFAVEVLVGTPARSRSLIVAFDNYITWTYCGPGTGKVPRQTPNALFYPQTSRTAVNASCSSSACLPILTTNVGACTNATCLFQLAYGSPEESVIRGHLVSDLMMLKNVSTSLVRYGGLGCVSFLNGSFVNDTSDGVLALGPAEGTFMEALREQMMIPDVLSFCFNASGYYERLSDPDLDTSGVNGYDGGSLVLGTPPEGIIYPTPLTLTPLNKTRLQPDFPFAQYVSRITSWSMESLQPIDATSPTNPDGKVTYFSSAFATFLPSEEYRLMATALTNAAKMRSTLVAIDVADYLAFMDLNSTCDVSFFPVLNLTFVGGQVLSVKPEDYAAYLPSNDSCIVLMPFKGIDNEYYELGTSVLQSKWITFDFSAGIGMVDGPGVLKIGTGPCS